MRPPYSVLARRMGPGGAGAPSGGARKKLDPAESTLGRTSAGAKADRAPYQVKTSPGQCPRGTYNLPAPPSHRTLPCS